MANGAYSKKMFDRLAKRVDEGVRSTREHIWWGTSIEDQESADELRTFE